MIYHFPGASWNYRCFRLSRRSLSVCSGDEAPSLLHLAHWHLSGSHYPGDHLFASRSRRGRGVLIMHAFDRRGTRASSGAASPHLSPPRAATPCTLFHTAAAGFTDPSRALHPGAAAAIAPRPISRGASPEGSLRRSDQALPPPSPATTRSAIREPSAIARGTTSSSTEQVYGPRELPAALPGSTTPDR
jgi:hypothetical protein